MASRFGRDVLAEMGETTGTGNAGHDRRAPPTAAYPSRRFLPPSGRFSPSVLYVSSWFESGRSARFHRGSQGRVYRLYSPCGDPLGAFRGCVVVVEKRFINLISQFYSIFGHLRSIFILLNWKKTQLI